MHSAVVHLHRRSRSRFHSLGRLAPRAATKAPRTKLTASREQGSGPIVPEMKELAWGAGSFIVFALLMRFFLFPKLKKGMDARYHGIRAAHESADAERAAARAEVADYEAQLAGIKAEAAAMVDAARVTLEAERQAKLAEVNAGIAEQRAAAHAQADAVRAAAPRPDPRRGHRCRRPRRRAGHGPSPGADVVDRVVSEVMAR